MGAVVRLTSLTRSEHYVTRTTTLQQAAVQSHASPLPILPVCAHAW